MAKKTPEEICENNKRRAAKLLASVPRSFRAGVRKAWAIDTSQMQQTVYGGSNKWGSQRSAKLLRDERYVDVSAKEAHITNRAKTRGGEYYAWYVHDGTRAVSAPTGGGKPVWVWMKGNSPRPTSKGGWKAARKAGQVVVSRKIGARGSRKWRSQCRVAMNNAVLQGIAEGYRRAVTE